MGKTPKFQNRSNSLKKHPHGRGEDAAMANIGCFLPETPPRAWGRRPAVGGGTPCRRNTPTGVGKTDPQRLASVEEGKHPHGRGEDDSGTPARPTRIETPPRAWGRRPGSTLPKSCSGNTPTGVGKTQSQWRWRWHSRKHPHGRGEDNPQPAAGRFVRETPPRAWGRPPAIRPRTGGCGNTPTGVGKTASRIPASSAG